VPSSALMMKYKDKREGNTKAQIYKAPSMIVNRSTRADNPQK